MEREAVCPECDEDFAVQCGWGADQIVSCPSCKTKFEWECDEFGGADLVLILTRV